MNDAARNEACPCGSGRPARICCGRSDPAVDAALRQAKDLHRQGAWERAEAAYRGVLAAQPAHAEALFFLGMLHHDRGDEAAALELLRRAIALQPENADFHYNLGTVLQERLRLEDAEAAYRRAIELNPSLSGPHNNLGVVLRELGRSDEAAASHKRAIKVMPPEHIGPVLSNLASALMDMGRAREALEQFAVAMSLAPRNVVTHSTYLATLNYMGHLEPGAVFEAHRKFGERFEPTVRRLPPAARPAGDDATRRPLRVGYLSPDLRTHAVAHFIEPVLAHHDRAAVESFCYHDSPIVDAVSRRLQSLAAHWTHAFGMSDDALAQRIQQDGIDILVDLAGHMGNERLLLLARKPASVQATWIGYPNTTGLTSIDFRITDALADPPGMTESLHTEQLVRLPECFSCYQPPADTPPVASLPALRNGFVTFGSFNNIAKMTPQVVQVWARILQRVPQARLTLKTKVLRSPSMQTLVRGAFAAHGVAGERLTLLGNDASVREHFDRCNAIDVALDPFPYNGTTTTLDALWMGVPVVSLAGRSHVGRVGVSQLSNLGLSELIARDEDDYVEIAARLAGDLPRLAALRSGLRERLRASPLMDAPRFTRHLEAAYRSMWQMRRL